MAAALPGVKRLTHLRGRLAELGVDAFLIPTDDSHGSEIPPECEKRRAFLTGFTGTAGTAVVTGKEALLWTDGRYFTQAENQLDSGHWSLMKAGLPATPTIAAWLRDNPEVSRVGYDPSITTIQSYKNLRKTFQERPNPTELVPISPNPVDALWESEGTRPAVPQTSVFFLSLEYSGVSTVKKLEDIRSQLEKEKVDGVVLTRLDDIAWVTNCRGSDIHCCPVFLAYLFVTKTVCRLYVNADRINDEAKNHLEESQVTLHPYENVFDDLKEQFGCAEGSARLWVDPLSNMRIFHCVEDHERRVCLKLSPVQELKAVKNPVELENMKEAHIRDALAVVTYLAWLEDLAARDEKQLTELTEYGAAKELDGFRKLLPDNQGLSFDTISAIGGNAAIIHYRAQEETAAHLARDLYLVDSGGQYLQGTTDITRTVHLGEPTAQQKLCYTLVLKGHLHLRRQLFPKGTIGYCLDCLARQYLWNSGLNYEHGTGHGVGAFLNVHEGPQGISARTGEPVFLQPSMVLSNEPGVYLVNQFGIRIENLVYVKKINEDLSEMQLGEYFGFEDLTLVPYQLKLIDEDLLTDTERQQINVYHNKVREVLQPRLLDSRALPHKDIALDWLQKATEAL